MKAKFIKSCAASTDFPKEGKPEIAVIGRSNVGKSSLLNFLFQTKGLVKTSQEPGKTRLINFFEADDEVLFVDLPGWGFAKASKSLRADWGDLIGNYLSERKPLKAVLFLLDIRRDPSEEDIEMAVWLRDQGQKVIYVITKADKVNQSEGHAQIKKLSEFFGEEPVITSAKAGKGRNHLLKVIKGAILHA